MKLVALIKPKGEILKEIKYFKKKIFEEIGSQTYLDHLPHVTIFSIDIIKMHINEKHKKKINLKKIKKKDLVLSVKKRYYFKNDPLTKKITFAIFFKKNSTLNLIQKALLKNFKDILNFKKRIIKNNFDKNYNLYGYHFVNNSWKPHCTIASVNKNNSKFYTFKQFLKNKKLFLKNLNIFIFMNIKEVSISIYGGVR